jgi:hypothetical protein
MVNRAKWRESLIRHSIFSLSGAASHLSKRWNMSPSRACLRRRVTAKEQRVGKVKMKAPLSHLTGRWRKHALDGETITPNYYEAAAFESLKARVRSGDVAVSGSRRYRSFENYLLSPAWQSVVMRKRI